MNVQSEQLQLKRTFTAPREEVYRAWTEPEVLRRWWAAAPTWECPVAQADVRVGGSYRLTMRDPESGEEHTVGGEYVEVEPPERLVYTWTWESNDEDSPSAGSIVTVEFRDDDAERTTVVLTHDGIAEQGSRDNHAHGWNGCLDNLAARVFGA
jgi:uncharacterized protein YndB with AHSA1/START domain